MPTTRKASIALALTALVLGIALGFSPILSRQARAEDAATENVYAILYESGHLVMQVGSDPDPAEGNVVQVYSDFLNKRHPDWLDRRGEIKKVTVKDKIKPSVLGSGATRYEQLSSSNGWFNGCGALEEAHLNNLDTSDITDVSCLFYGCTSMRVCEIGDWDLTKVRNSMFFFAYCQSLEKLVMPKMDLAYTARFNWGMDIDLSIVFTHVRDFDISNMYYEASTSFVNLFSFMGTRNRYERITLGDRQVFWGPEGSSDYTRIPEGYTWESEQDGSILTSTELMAAHIADPSGMAGSYHLYHDRGEYAARDLGLENMWRTDEPTKLFKGYCMNLHREGVFGYYDRVEITDDSVLEEQFLDGAAAGSVHGHAPLGSDMREALMTLIYFGYNGTDTGRPIQEKYGLTDEEYMDVTQEAIWDFTDRYDAKRGPTHFTGNKLKAYNELTSKNFSEIPGEWKLYLYLAKESGRQNLLSIDGVEKPVAHGGIRLNKLCVESRTSQFAMPGAVFNIYRCASEEEARSGNFGEPIKTLVTDVNGIAATGQRELEAGWYAVEEVESPRGYMIGWVDYYRRYYAVNITRDNTFYEVGYRYDDGRDLGSNYLEFTDAEDTTVTGGGLVLRKTNEDGSRLLGGAEFEVVDSSGQVVATLVTDAVTGEARTPGNKDIPFGTYTVRESKAPEGYHLSGETREVTISENRTYVELGEPFTDKGKEGSATVEVEKTLDGRELEEGQFSFDLFDSAGNLLQTVACGADGKAAFEPLTFGAEDLGYKNYYIREIVPDDAVNADGQRYGDADPAERDEDIWTLDDYTYDAHEEWITITVYDNGEDELVCEVVTDEDGILFENSYGTDEPDEPVEPDEPDEPDDEGEIGPSSSEDAKVAPKSDAAKRAVPDTGDEGRGAIAAQLVAAGAGATLVLAGERARRRREDARG